MCQYGAFIFLILHLLVFAQGTKIEQQKHKTKEATEVRNDLYCHSCSTMHAPKDDLEDHVGFCENINKTNNFTKKCDIDETFCIVTRFSYTTSTEHNTTEKKLWTLQRNCTKTCKSGCIVIGERTKLYACSTCCTNSLCNVMSKSPYNSPIRRTLQLGVFIILICLKELFFFK